ncbi:MAG: nucleoside deaminase [Bryobacterales bacterium]|nr:nucleoside deaminase [Bryobacterales bacterium]
MATIGQLLYDPENDPAAAPAVPVAEITPEDERFMRLAIEEARRGLSTPGCAEVGCVIVVNGAVVASGCNEVELRHDPTAHAEVVTLRKLGEQIGEPEFRGATLYCTLQPCGMCTVACLWAKISRIVYGATRTDVHSMYFDTRHFDAADLIRDSFRDDIEIVGGVLAEECAQLYYRPEDNPPAEEQKNQ